MSAAPVVLLQTRGGWPWSPSVAVARQGFEALGYDVVAQETAAADHDVAVGTVGFVRRALELRGVQAPEVTTLPGELAPFFGRSVWRTTLGEIRQNDAPVFLKPVDDSKRFTGHVRGDPAQLSITAQLPDATPVLASEVLSFEAEWRCFICRGVCVGARQYAGPVFAPKPPASFVREMVSALGASAFAGYSLDVGLLAGSGQPVLVEMNDGYGLGAYGLEPVPYAQVLEARFIELAGPA